MSKNDEKLLIIGFDGASPNLLERWVEEGKLPTIARLMEEGAYGSLRSVPTMSSPPAWSSLVTGKNPGKHGIFAFTERKFDEYRYSYVNGSHRKEPAFWKLLGDDLVLCIINVPISYPAEKVNGCMIAGLDAPGVDSSRVCYPEGLIEELTDRNGRYSIMPDFGGFLRRGARWGATLREFLDSMDRRRRHSEYLMQKYPWDLFKVVFNETDLAHHFFWKFQDPEHPDYRESEAREFGDAILKVYQKMDEITAAFMQQAPGATVMLVSDHGGAINTRGTELINDWLANLGLYSRDERGGKGLPSRIVEAVTRSGYNLLTKYLSQSLKHKLARRMPQMREKAEAAVRLKDIDWSRTRAFCDGAQDDIWINLAGRDPQGIVDEGEYDQLCDFICEELGQAVDVVTGESIVDAVFRPRDVYSGDYVHKAADISVRWKTEKVIYGISTPACKGKVIEPKKWTWEADHPNGGHSLDGIVLAACEGIRSGTRVEDAEIADIAPTVLYLFDREIPADMDGRVLEGIFDEDRLSSRPPRIAATGSDKVQKDEDIYTDEDSDVIEKRLQDLGYI